MSTSALCSSTSRVEANWPCRSEYCEWAEPSSAPLDLIIIISHLLHYSLMRHIAPFWHSLFFCMCFFFSPCCLPTSYHFYVSLFLTSSLFPLFVFHAPAPVSAPACQYGRLLTPCFTLHYPPIGLWLSIRRVKCSQWGLIQRDPYYYFCQAKHLHWTGVEVEIINVWLYITGINYVFL